MSRKRGQRFWNCTSSCSCLLMILVLSIMQLCANRVAFAFVTEQPQTQSLQQRKQKFSPLSIFGGGDVASFSASNTLLRNPIRRYSTRREMMQSLSVQEGNHNEKNPNKRNYGFEQLSQFNRRLESVELSVPETLATFFEPHLLSFSVKPGSATRFSILSTCYSLLAIAQGDKGIYESYVDYNVNVDAASSEQGLSSFKKIPIRQIIPELLNSQWNKDDVFQVSLVLFTLLTFDNTNTNDKKDDSASTNLPFLNSCTNEATIFKVQTLISQVLSVRPKRRNGSQQLLSGYLTYLCCQVYGILQDSVTSSSSDNNNNSKLLQVLPEGAASEIPLALARCSEFSFNELCRQIAYHSAGDTTCFDVNRLAYALLTYIKSTDNLSGIAGMEMEPGQGLSPNTKPLQQNRRVVQEALEIFFKEQRSDGMWAQGQPIYRSFRKQGRNIGNAFVFALDTIGSLLELLPAEDFRSHLSGLERTLEWVETHQTIEVIADYCDPYTGQCYGKPLRGWISPHLMQSTGPEAWSTAQVGRCIHLMKRTIRELMHNDVLKEFNGEPLSSMGKRSDSWDNLLDSDLSNPCKKDGDCNEATSTTTLVPCRTIKSVLEERVILPFENGVDNPSFGMVYSVILFGPPGTAKTTICEALAKTMGWDFVVIDTANFLANGSANIASTIRYVFQRLMALKECVILFDEIEEFCLNRETPGLSMESRMLTTAMLTAINDLRRTKQSIFFLATNRLRAFDSAITRPGRFDIQLYVGTPNLDARIIQLEQQLSSISTVQQPQPATIDTDGEEEEDSNNNASSSNNIILSESRKQQAIDSYRIFLESVWSEDAMFMNFLEGKQFASSCANIVASGRELTRDEMERLFKQQAAVMTVRGSIREEYIASMELTRL